MAKKIAQQFVIFILSVSAILAAGHFLFYLILKDALAFLPNFPGFFITIFLSASFFCVFLSQLLISRFENGYVAAFYFLVMSWIGIAWQGFVAYLLAIIIRLVFSVFWPLSPLAFGLIFLILTALISFFGFWGAFSTHLKEIEIPIDNLPDFWQGKKIIQLSDVHLGAIYRQKSMARIVRLVGKVRPELVLITGDLFDGTDGDFSQSGKELLALHAPEGVFFVCGNHESRLVSAGPIEHLTGSGIELLDNRLVNVHGLQILGVAYPKKGVRSFSLTKAIKSLPGFDRQKPNILMFHQPIQFAEAADAGVDLYLSGHTHYGQMFPFNLLADLVYHGYSYGVKKFNNMTALISSGVGTWGPPLRTLSRSEIVVIKLTKK